MASKLAIKCRAAGGVLLLALVVFLAAMASACGGGGPEEPLVLLTPASADESAIVDAIVAAVNGLNARDPVLLREHVTDSFVTRQPGQTFEQAVESAPDSFRIEGLRILKIEMDKDEAAALVTRTIDGELVPETVFLVRQEGRWLLDRVTLPQTPEEGS